jgi:hypothetical protein
MCDPKTPITIEKVEHETGNDLLGCYFRCVTEADELFIYKFFAKDDKELLGDLKVGTKFDVSVAGKKFVLNIIGASCEMVRGFFTDANDWEPDQSYQAQAGIPAPTAEENAAAATV